MLVLSVIQGPDKGRTYELPANEPQLIGRSSEALPSTDTTMSRRHAELTPDDGEWFIRDLSSQNGTYVNGVKIAERTRLRVGDQVRTGSTLPAHRQGDTEVRFLESGSIRTGGKTYTGNTYVYAPAGAMNDALEAVSDATFFTITMPMLNAC